MTPMFCEKVIYMTNSFGKNGTRQCGRPAFISDRFNRRLLCRSCFNKWEKKLNKANKENSDV
jgi:hypothetical protein